MGQCFAHIPHVTHFSLVSGTIGTIGIFFTTKGLLPGNNKVSKSVKELISFNLFVIANPKSVAIFKSSTSGLPVANLFVDECSVINVAAPNAINPFDVKISYCSRSASS
ncbi:hypothetical protein D3C73_1433280 [compost metagenome]